MLDILELIAQGENSAVEFKAAAVRPDSLAKELVAFANAGGGTILCGVSDHGGIESGIEPEKFEEWAANISRNNVIPPLVCDVSVAQISQKIIGIIKVPKGPDRPYQTLNNQYLVRVGSTNRVATVQELMRLFQQAGVFHFDANPVAGASVKDLSTHALDAYLARYDLSLSDEPSIENLLSNMDVLAREQPTLAGLLIFGVNPQRFLPNACISYAHYAGAELGADLIDKQVLGGTLPEQIDKTLAVVKNNQRSPSTIVGARRELTRAQYPDYVFRELIVNAVTHRNYSISGSRIRIQQFEDRIEFISPGRLPNTVTVEKLKFGVSYASNPIILKFLENMRYIDKLGRGLPMVYSEAKKLGVNVVFEEFGEEFRVSLPLA